MPLFSSLPLKKSERSCGTLRGREGGRKGLREVNASERCCARRVEREAEKHLATYKQMRD